MEYREVPFLARDSVEEGLQSRDHDVRCDSLLSAAYYDPDWQWVQDVCLLILARNDDPLKSLAITCLGHVARIHRVIDLKRVLPVLEALSCDPELAPYVADTIECDFKMFLHAQWPDGS